MLNILSEETVKFVQNYFKVKPQIAVVLGSGVKALENLENEKQLSFTEIPDFPKSTVAGHAGVISVGKYGKATVAVLRGRFHKYEGHNWKNVISPISLMKELGVNYSILTNAAGGVNRLFVPGDLMLIEDHVNFHLMEEEERGALSQIFKSRRCVNFYDSELTTLAKEASLDEKITLHSGVYASLPGPCYETRAEILMFRKMNVDAVGMSTVPEVIWSKAFNMKVLGISCITNSTYYEKAMSETSHEEVVAIAKKSSQNIDLLLKNIINNLNF